MSLTIRAACATDTGCIRSNNEDNFFFNSQYLPEIHDGTPKILQCDFTDRESLWLAIFDGMGGENYGELASFAAAEALDHSALKRAAFPSAAAYASEVAQELNLAVVEKMKLMRTAHMGTTMAALYFSGGRAVTCNLGDSRVYRLRNGTLWQLSEDHVSTRPMAPGRKAPLTQNLGVDPEELLLEPSVNESVLRSGDRFLICSDGVTDMLEDQRIAELLSESPDSAGAVKALVAAALEAGGQDNTTAIVCYVEGTNAEETDIPTRDEETWEDRTLKPSASKSPRADLKPMVSLDEPEKSIAVQSPAGKKRPGLMWLFPVLLLAAVLVMSFLRKSGKDQPPEPTCTPEPEVTATDEMKMTVYKEYGVVDYCVIYDVSGKRIGTVYYNPDGSRSCKEIY